MWERNEGKGRATAPDRSNTFVELSSEIEGMGSDDAPPTPELEFETENTKASLVGDKEAKLRVRLQSHLLVLQFEVLAIDNIPTPAIPAPPCYRPLTQPRPAQYFYPIPPTPLPSNGADADTDADELAIPPIPASGHCHSSHNCISSLACANTLNYASTCSRTTGIVRRVLWSCCVARWIY
jgi:hypothetical protein